MYTWRLLICVILDMHTQVALHRIGLTWNDGEVESVDAVVHKSRATLCLGIESAVILWRPSLEQFVVANITHSCLVSKEKA